MDNVNHPAHYEQSCSLECIQVMKLLLGNEGVAHFCMGNAFKYMWRYKNKNGKEDLDKAEWYLNYIANENIDQELSYKDLNIYSGLLWMLGRIRLNENIKKFNEKITKEASS